jgi:hypothetical protein
VNNVALKFACGFLGTATGVTGNPNLKTSIGKVVRCAPLGTGWQIYDATGTPLTILGGATTTLNLLTGLTNPLNEAISAAPFVRVFGVLIVHDRASLASSIEAFGGASSNLFQGPWDAAAKATLIPGKWIAFGIDSDLTGDLRDATHKNIDLKNLDGVNAATVNAFILGKTT